ncbi:hypothetical protein [Streptomyces sp. NPDC058297]|uniref:hypothetical protein n=1 Tax=Streptomyces sp. NPDC058297 TaxID=3346433 RepID=UPI0036E0799B
MSPFKRVLLAAGSVAAVAVVTLAIGACFVRLWSGAGVSTASAASEVYVLRLQGATDSLRSSPELLAYIGTLEIPDDKERCAGATSA